MPHVCLEEAHGAGESRMRRHEYFGYVEVACKIGSVQRPSAAEGQECKAAWILSAALEREPQVDGHIGINDLKNTGGGRHQIEAKRPSNGVHDGPLGKAGVERHAAAKQALGSERAEDEVCVGDGRCRATAAVAGRTGHGACTLRADLHQSVASDPGDRSAAGARRQVVCE